ncbi:nucleotidyl transferase AbiEii/AbiGii toxin family protein [Kiritimatiella glycovorans]|uniref:Nucleotidyl transferase AbiEii/AbiGii toxin family protein n=1 Tax=Kiritimatiella glycovorans TaxID=1307763 RepID=A0A0G3EB13_9BACT|nr:nucleotidyl transferase AbiEii/AbiGii toxin family protein [Kiritimatiella glycovorans]AKJ63468.1 hypothetical protein L21SP4_00184 [Kiritimatiella glycovorans]
MHERVLPKHSLELLSELAGDSSALMAGWRLAGGTGLALRYGHRISEDLDLFRNEPFSVEEMHGVLSAYGGYETWQEKEGHTLTVLLRGTKLSFFSVRDPFLFEPEQGRFFPVADTRDIALMKLAAVSGRGSRKDFIDLHVILRKPPALKEYFAMLPRKYDPARINTYHILKSLTYFEDAESEPMPRMLVPFDWEECKAFFVREARTLVLR